MAHSQERVTTFGVQLKPLVPLNLVGTGVTQSAGENNLYSVQQRVGLSFGGVIRRGVTDWLSIESGINYTRRNYLAYVENRASGFSDSSYFGIIGYEIPITGLVFVKLSEKWFMDAAFGVAMDMFPSDVGSNGNKPAFGQKSFRTSWSKNKDLLPWLNSGLIANIGFEYRTEHSGYFYFGGSYHRPFRRAYNSLFIYDYNGVQETGSVPLLGSYLTLDFKYFFHEDKEE